MRHMLLLYVDGTADRSFAEMAAFHAECEKRGVLVGSDPLQEPATATTVRVRGGRTMKTDGPFAEATEWLGGYFVLDCELDEALELAERCPTARGGSVEVRPIMDVR
jgi:hypothetical protein